MNFCNMTHHLLCWYFGAYFMLLFFYFEISKYIFKSTLKHREGLLS